MYEEIGVRIRMNNSQRPRFAWLLTLTGSRDQTPRDQPQGAQQNPPTSPKHPEPQLPTIGSPKKRDRRNLRTVILYIIVRYFTAHTRLNINLLIKKTGVLDVGELSPVSVSVCLSQLKYILHRAFMIKLAYVKKYLCGLLFSISVAKGPLSSLFPLLLRSNKLLRVLSC